MFPHLTSELAMQRRGALLATADRRRVFGRTARRATDAGDVMAADAVSVAPLMRLPIPSDRPACAASTSSATQNAA
jgi:hypothetical protein